MKKLKFQLILQYSCISTTIFPKVKNNLMNEPITSKVYSFYDTMNV